MLIQRNRGLRAVLHKSESLESKRCLCAYAYTMLRRRMGEWACSSTHCYSRH